MDTALKNKVILRLASLGYSAYTGADDFALEMIHDKVTAYICHVCNIATVPTDCMEAEIVDAISGEFLAGKKATGGLSDMELDSVVKAITEGDTKVEFATGSTGTNELFDAYITKLSRIDCNTLIAHRKLVW